MLSERLRVLEAEGIITRHVLPDPPIKVEYELTQKGKELQKSLEAIGLWAERWIDAGSISTARETKPARKPARARAKTSTRAQARASRA